MRRGAARVARASPRAPLAPALLLALPLHDGAHHLPEWRAHQRLCGRKAVVRGWCEQARRISPRHVAGDTALCWALTMLHEIAPTSK